MGAYRSRSYWFLFLLLTLGTALLYPTYAEKPVENSPASSYLDEQFVDEAAIINDLRNRQLEGIAMVPPSAPAMLFDQGIHVFDPKKFDKTFLDALLGIERSGVTVYPVLVFEDKTTREVVFVNAGNTEILAVSDAAYEPLWILYEKHPELNNTVRSDDEFVALAEQYDPARVAVQYHLLAKRDLDAYLAAQPSEPDFPIVMMSMGGSPTNILITAIERDSTSIDVTISYPTNVMSLDIFSVDGGNGLPDFWWNLRDTVSLSGSTNETTWTDSSTSGIELRCYAVANADTNSATDTDDDGLTWGREHFMYHTSPTNSDTDGDGIRDDVEVLTNNTDPNNDDTNSPTVMIDSPAQGATWVWMP